jgi:hypothetical protein
MQKVEADDCGPAAVDPATHSMPRCPWPSVPVFDPNGDIVSFVDMSVYSRNRWVVDMCLASRHPRSWHWGTARSGNCSLVIVNSACSCGAAVHRIVMYVFCSP